MRPGSLRLSSSIKGSSEYSASSRLMENRAGTAQHDLLGTPGHRLDLGVLEGLRLQEEVQLSLQLMLSEQGGRPPLGEGQGDLRVLLPELLEQPGQHVGAEEHGAAHAQLGARAALRAAKCSRMSSSMAMTFSTCRI